MKVKKLIELLKKEDPEAIVICQKDAEGNGHSPLSCICEDGYIANNKWSGDRYLHGYTTEDAAEDAVKAVFLIPVN